MKAFTIDAENNITAHGSRAAAATTGDGVFTSEEGLGRIVGSNGKRLIEIWNSMPGVAPVKKFTNSKVAVARIWKAIQTLEAETEAEVEPEVKPPKAKKERAPKAAAGAGTPREGSKVAQVIEMLKRKSGATLDQINTAMGWQPHTTRALMSAGGSIYKKFGLTVTSENVDGVRTYRIA